MLWYNTHVAQRELLRGKISFYYTHIGTIAPVSQTRLEAYDPDVVEKPEREDMKNVSNHH